MDHFGQGLIASTYDARDYKIVADKEFPTSFELVTVPVKNQGGTCSCVAFATSYIIEFHNKKQTENYREFSTEFIYGLRDVGHMIGTGMMLRNALSILRKYGDCYVEDCPGNNEYDKAMETVRAREDELKDLAYPHRISSYMRLYGEADIKTALTLYGPVLVSMNTYEGWGVGDDDIMHWKKSSKHGRHGVVIYGWNEKGWLVQNSWGDKWARDGRFIIPFDFKFNEAWGVTDEIIEDKTIRPKRGPIQDAIYSIWNAIANLWIKITKKN